MVSRSSEFVILRIFGASPKAVRLFVVSVMEDIRDSYKHDKRSLIVSVGGGNTEEYTVSSLLALIIGDFSILDSDGNAIVINRVLDTDREFVVVANAKTEGSIISSAQALKILKYGTDGFKPIDLDRLWGDFANKRSGLLLV